RRRPPPSTSFPCTTLFRSRSGDIILTYHRRSGSPIRDQSHRDDFIVVFQTLHCECRTVKGNRLTVDLAPVAGGYRQCFFINAERSEEHTSELQSREKLVCR